MKKYRYKKDPNCIHGVPKNRPEPCPACKSVNAYAKKDVESLARTYDKRKPNNFALAFDIKEKFNKWKKIYSINSFDYYLYELQEMGNLKFNISTLKHVYYTAVTFPDLELINNRKMSFSAYSEIANSSLRKEEKKTLRKEIEEAGKMSVARIRETITTRYGSQEKIIRGRFVYATRELCLKNIEQFIEMKASFLKPNDVIIVTIKHPRSQEKTITASAVIAPPRS